MLPSLGRTTLRTVTRPTNSNKYRTTRYNIIRRLTENLDRNNHRKFCRGKEFFLLDFFQKNGFLTVKNALFWLKIWIFQICRFWPKIFCSKIGPGVETMTSKKINLVSLDPEWHSKCQKIWFFKYLIFCVYLLCLNFFRCQNLFFTSFEIFPFLWHNQCPLYQSNIDSIGWANPKSGLYKYHKKFGA